MPGMEKYDNQRYVNYQHQKFNRVLFQEPDFRMVFKSCIRF